MGRGRDTGHPVPPAQIRACGTTAHGSYLGCLASKRTSGYGCRTLGRGSQGSQILMKRPHVMR